ncbi:MAG: hypothetical protein QOD77_1182 [Thermoplasmata archaeon]|jgi:hypothetical protein|nr:hypothetical protein [Thermoplasmata archaeon]
MLRLSAALLLAATLLAPALNADVVPVSRDLKFSDLEHLEYAVAGRYTNSDAHDLRDAVDTDNDGTVSTTEETWFKGLIESYGSGVGATEPRVDNVSATSGTMTVTVLTGLAGLVGATSPIDLTLTRTLTFPPAASASEHKLYVPNADPEPNSAVQVLRAPAGWIIDGTAGFPPGATVSSSKDRITFSEDGSGAATMVLTFHLPPSGSTTSSSSSTTTSASSTSGSSTTGSSSSSTSGTKSSTSSGAGTTGTSSDGTTGSDLDDGEDGSGTSTSSSGNNWFPTPNSSSSSTTGSKPKTSGTAAQVVLDALDDASSSGLPRGDLRTRPAAETEKDAPAVLVLPAVGALLALAALRRRLP